MQAQCYEFLSTNKDCELILTADDKQALHVKQVANFLGLNSFVLPDFRANFGDDLRSFSVEFLDFLVNLNLYYNEKKSKKLLISPIRTALNCFPKPSLLRTKNVNFGDEIDIKSLKNELLCWGYSFVDVVEAKGEVSFRGDIIDIFSPQLDEPIRISLFDSEVESIRFFSTQSQKSILKEIEQVTFFPALFSLNNEQYDILTQKVQNFQSDAFLQDIQSLGFWCLDEKEDFLSTKKAYAFEEVKNELKELNDDVLGKNELNFISQASHYKDIVAKNKAEFLTFHKNKKVTILARNEALIKQAGIILDENMTYMQSLEAINIYNDEKVIISLNSPFTKPKMRKKASIILDELKINDYVVHENYGIGIFKGLTNTKVLGISKDFVSIEYQGDDKLLLPVENLDVIDRYISESGTLAVLDKLGKGSFAKLKEKTKEKLFEIANEIINIAAKRELVEGKKISIDYQILEKFRHSSGFIYTNDQDRALNDMLNDLKSGNVMDRLLSADVGFGKTEIAMNAILACVKSGYQAFFVAPTTLLSSQHYKSLHARLSPFDVNVKKLDRFTSAKNKSQLIHGLVDESVHVVVGTHALLGLEPKNLGLLIIDEEHKFGVKQKEKLKQLAQNIHLLSMSATPIPRSLNMALSSIKSYSQILTPPLDREDVRTFVKEYDEKLLKEVILREIRRGGQIFYVHNRIASIEQKAKQIAQIYPKLRILVLHSQVSSAQSEKQMLEFEEGKFDMLVSTSIIESGIHLPNVNTIIVESSDRFGMADLHQLRGRVGRGKTQGYCYFLVKDKQNLTDQAKKRLIALESNSFLGSGSVLAYHDLEIRGGGNLVGQAQSGHIKNIGYSLYLKMLENAINTLLNKEVMKKNDVDMKLNINAFLSEELISEDRVRLELYRRLSKCKSVNEVYEIEGEIEDRFGKLDNFSKQFLQMMIVKILSSMQNITSISNYAQNITITYQNDTKTLLKAKSKDDDDILDTLLIYLRKKGKK